MINKESLKKFTIESAAIISSILIAFSIDSYWDIYKQEQSQKAAIEALKMEFEESHESLKGAINQKNGVVKRMTKLILMTDVEVKTLEAKESKEMINSLSTVYTYIPLTASLDSLVSSGELNKINNKKLREALASYRSELESLNRTQKWALETINLRTIPFLAERIPMHLFSYNGPIVESNAHDLTNKLNPKAVSTYIAPLFDEIAFRNLAQNRLLSARLTILKLKVLQECVVEVCMVLNNKKCISIEA